jgi:hypothetical protein
MRFSRSLRATTGAVAVLATLGAPIASADDIELRRDGSKAVPVTPLAEPVDHADGFDWRDGGIGAAAGMATLLVAGTGAHLARSRRASRRAVIPA